MLQLRTPPGQLLSAHLHFGPVHGASDAILQRTDAVSGSITPSDADLCEQPGDDSSVLDCTGPLSGIDSDAEHADSGSMAEQGDFLKAAWPKCAPDHCAHHRSPLLRTPPHFDSVGGNA